MARGMAEKRSTSTFQYYVLSLAVQFHSRVLLL
jgi:hypothetical protein